jgi:hypothetical protein
MKILLAASSLLLFAGIVGSFLLFLDLTRFYGHSLQATLPHLMGVPAGSVIREIGEPRRRYTGSQYRQSEHERIVESFDPPAPMLKCQEVLEYTNGNYMALIFIRDGRVFKYYWGQT